MPLRNELSGWKAIADYLRVGVRTAQEYEKDRGLPVYHQPGVKGRVFAYPDELDVWRVKGRILGLREASPESQSSPVLEPPVPSPPPGGAANLPVGLANKVQPLLTQRVVPKSWLLYLAAAAILGASGLGFAGARFLKGARQAPTAYRIEGATLVVFGRDNAELWRWTFPQELREAAYQQHPISAVSPTWTATANWKPYSHTCQRARPRLPWSRAWFASAPWGK